MRTLIAMALACTVGLVATLALIHFGPHSAGIGVAVIAGAVLVVELVNAVRRKRERMRRGRDAVWQRRESEVPFWQLPPNPFEDVR